MEQQQQLGLRFQMVHSFKHDLQRDLSPFEKSSNYKSFLGIIYGSMTTGYLLQFLGATVVVLFCLVFYRWRQRNLIGPKYWPMIGSMLLVFGNYQHMHDWILDFLEGSRTFRVQMPFRRLYYCTVDQANVKHLLDSNSINYRKGHGYFTRMEVLVGERDLNASFLMRRWTASEYSHSTTADMSAEALKKSTCTIARILSQVAFEAGIVDVQELLRRASLDAVGKVALGMDFASMPNNLRSDWPREHMEFCTALDSATEIVMKRFIDPVWELKRYLNIGEEAMLAKHMKVLNDFIYNVVSDRKCELDHFHGQIYDLAQAYRATAEGEWCGDWDVETFSFVMTDRIRDYARLLTSESLNELPYLHACITETLRLYPVVPLDPMDIEADDILPEGCTVKGKKGNMVFLSPYAMARLPAIWGPDAMSFNPQRWIHGGKFVPESEFKFVTFQAGLYTCNLKDVIYQNCKVAAAILGRFFEFVYGGALNHQPRYRMTSTLVVENGLKIYPRLRD
ncbi:hypothetical protein R1flu_005633 [Riccia fluitans]|uniref:Cytochrome P450 n=1 Tax=Riccia fluitans TaxID=41844 RepID=A0ABD1YUN1_9MARC